MTMKPAESLVYEFIAGLVEAADEDTDLFELEVHDTVFQKITQEAGIRVADGTSTLSPGPGGAMKEFDADVEVVVFVRIPKETPKSRLESRDRAFTITAALVAAIVASNTLGNRVCDCTVWPVARGYDNYNSAAYAVVSIPLVINSSGQRAR